MWLCGGVLALIGASSWSWSRRSTNIQHVLLNLDGFGHTDAVSHAGNPTFFSPASFTIFSYIDRMCLGAGVVFGRAWAALMNAFRESESFDMFASSVSLRCSESGEAWSGAEGAFNGIQKIWRSMPCLWSMLAVIPQ
jgi:hypothetical protein